MRFPLARFPLTLLFFADKSISCCLIINLLITTYYLVIIWDYLLHLLLIEGITYIHFFTYFFWISFKKEKKSSLQESIICETTVIYLLWFHERISWKHDYEMICKINLTKKAFTLGSTDKTVCLKIISLSTKSKEIRNWKTEKLFVLWLNEDAVLIYTYCIFIR